jgi:hypothetical protein
LRDGRQRFRNSWLFKFLEKKRMRMNFSEYLYVVARQKDELCNPGTIIDLSAMGALRKSPKPKRLIVRHWRTYSLYRLPRFPTMSGNRAGADSALVSRLFIDRPRFYLP